MWLEMCLFHGEDNEVPRNFLKWQWGKNKNLWKRWTASWLWPVTQDGAGAVCSLGMKLKAGNAPKREESGPGWPEYETAMTSLTSVAGETTVPAGGTAPTEEGTAHSESSGESHASVTAREGDTQRQAGNAAESNGEPPEAVERCRVDGKRRCCRPCKGYSGESVWRGSPGNHGVAEGKDRESGKGILMVAMFWPLWRGLQAVMSLSRRGTCAVPCHGVVTPVLARLGAWTSSLTAAPPAPATPSSASQVPGSGVCVACDGGLWVLFHLGLVIRAGAWGWGTDTSSRLSSQARLSWDAPILQTHPSPLAPLWAPRWTSASSTREVAPAQTFKPAPTGAGGQTDATKSYDKSFPVVLIQSLTCCVIISKVN